MDIVIEKKELPVAVVPARVRRKHIPVLPGICLGAEDRAVLVRVVDYARGPDEYAVSEHVDVVGEGEGLERGVISSAEALDDLTVLVPHRPASFEYGDAVLGVVVQKPGSQEVAVLVLELHERSPELGKVLVYEIDHTVAGQDCGLLEYLHVAYRLDLLDVHVPEGGVAEQEGIVVQKTRRPGHLAVVDAAFLNELH